MSQGCRATMFSMVPGVKLPVPPSPGRFENSVCLVLNALLVPERGSRRGLPRRSDLTPTRALDFDRHPRRLVSSLGTPGASRRMVDVRGAACGARVSASPRDRERAGGGAAPGAA